MTLGTTRVFSGFAVADIPAANAFYSDTLGLDVDEQNGMLHIRIGDGHEVLVYPKPDHAPAGFTILNLLVEDIDAAVAHLNARGVEMIRYEAFDHDPAGIVRDSGGPLIGWFTDPAGNVLSVLQEP